jgi:hypothetical protein
MDFFSSIFLTLKLTGALHMTPINVLILGASYGSLLATKVVMAGHHATMVCLPAEAELFNTEGAIIRTPVKGRDGLVEIRSRDLAGKLAACAPGDADPAAFDLVVLAMQEPQYSAPEIGVLLQKIARSGVPTMSIMNMPPLAFLRRLSGLDIEALRECFADSTVWDAFNPDKFTLCSPDPQAFRPPEENLNVLQVRLPTNFKAARLKGDEDTAILHRLQADIESARFTDDDGNAIEIPVKLKVHDSVFVPMAKWAMLIAGNYRCIGKDEMRPIQQAVHSDIAASEAIYNWVVDLCISLGSDPADLVPFEKYANAALSLGSPSSAARALAGGAKNIERVDKLVQSIAAQKGQSLNHLDEIVGLVDHWLTKNRG